MNPQEAIQEVYSNGWNPDLIKIVEQDGGIKVKGSLTRMNWGMIKFEFHVCGYSYDKSTKLFKKTHEETKPLLHSHFGVAESEQLTDNL